MALFAAVVPRSTGKLALMLIGMAIDTKRKLHLEPGIISRRHMTCCALHARMRKSEGEVGLCMVGGRERRRTPTLNGMAAFATSTVRPFCKLAAVWIRLMAIHTGIVRNRRFEVSTLMTTQTGHLEVLSHQRIVRARVIESLSKGGFLPAKCVVAGTASLFECAVVRIFAVAIRARRKGQPRVPRLPVRSRGVTAFA